MKKAISILLSVLVICMSLFVPTVMAETTNTDDSELLFDGSFEATKLGKLSYAKAYEDVTYENAHIWYLPSHESAIVEDGTNKALNLNRFAYQSVEIFENTSYVLKFKAKNASSDLNITASLRNLRDRNAILVSKNIAVATGEEWVEYTAVFEVADLFDGVVDYTFGLDAGANNSVLIDDISFKAIPEYKVTVSATEGGTATVSADVVKEGETATFTAEPSMKYKFEGWFYEGVTEPVSTDLVYSVTVTSDIALIAKFIYNTELLYDGSFEATKLGIISWRKEYDVVTYENAHIWYRPSSSSAVVEDGANKALNLNRFAYQSVEIFANTSYVLKFKAKNASSDLNITASLRNLRDRNTILVSKNVAVATGEEWVEYSVVLEVGELLADVTDYTLGLDAGNGNSVFIDDVSFKAIPKYNVAVTATEGGTATVSADVVKEGETATFTAEPSEGYEFVGWSYINKTDIVSTNKIYEATVNSDITLIARFEYVGVSLLYDGGFEVTKTEATGLLPFVADKTGDYNSLHKWFATANRAEIVEDEDNKVLKFDQSNKKQHAYQSVKIDENTAYILKFKAKNASADFNFTVYLKYLLSRTVKFVSKDIAISTGEEWVEYSTIIDVGSFMEYEGAVVTDYALHLDVGVGNAVLIDDVSFKAIPKYNVAVTATEGGTATVSADVVKEGETVIFTAEPLEGYVFVGWSYLDSTDIVSTNKIYEATVNSDITLVAQFEYVGVSLLYDGSFEATKLGKLSYAKAYEDVTYENAHIWYLPSHESAIVEDGTNKALNLNRFAYQSVKIAGNTAYILKFKAKNASSDLTLTVYLRNLRNRSQTLLYKNITVAAGEEWVEYSVVIYVNDLIEGVSDYALGLDAGSGQSVLIDDISMKNILSTAYNNAAALRTANASSTGKNGLRIYNEIKKDWIKDANIVEFGSIAAFTDRLAGTQFTHQTSSIVEGVAYKQNVQEMILWIDGDTSYIYTSYLSNINEKYYGKDIAIRTYAVDAEGNYYYGDVVVVSVFQVANSIDNGYSLNGNAPSETDQAAFYAFITAETEDEYAQWCEVNGLAVGNLYTQKYVD